MRFPLTALLVVAATACGDGAGLTAPDALPAPAAPAALDAADPVRDALDRVGPALGFGPAAGSLRGLLASAIRGETAPDAAAFEAALDQLAADPALAVEADVIRLALAASRS